MRKKKLINKLITKYDEAEIDKLVSPEFLEKYNALNIINVANHLEIFMSENKTLTDEQVEFLCKKYNNEKFNGIDIQYCIPRIVLIEYMKPLIIRVLKMIRANIYDEDLFEIGLIGLISAVDNYDYESGAKFITFAVHCIRNILYYHLRSTNNQKRDKEGNNIAPISFEDFKNENNEKMDIEEVLSDDYDLEEEVADKDFVKYVLSFLKYLTPTEQYCLRTYLGLGIEKNMTLQEIATSINTSKQWISLAYDKALKKLKTCLHKPDSLSTMKVYHVLTDDEIKNIDRSLLQIN